MDISTAKSEIARGRHDMRTAKQERADAFWQQTIEAGRQAKMQSGQQQQEGSAKDRERQAE
jgi:hypothetical protein